MSPFSTLPILSTPLKFICSIPLPKLEKVMTAVLNMIKVVANYVILGQTLQVFCNLKPFGMCQTSYNARNLSTAVLYSEVQGYYFIRMFKCLLQNIFLQSRVGIQCAVCSDVILCPDCFAAKSDIGKSILQFKIPPLDSNNLKIS